MQGPGKLRHDPPEEAGGFDELPSPKVVRRSRDARRRSCPWCGDVSPRIRQVQRILHDLGDPASGRPRVIHLTYSQHYCPACRKYFNTDMSDLAPRGSHYTHRVIDRAVRLVVEDGWPYRAATSCLVRDLRVFVPYTTIRNWVEAEERGDPDNAAGVSRRRSGRSIR